MDNALQWLLDLVSQNRGWAPAAIFIVAALDSMAGVSLLLPSTPFMVAIGALVAAGSLDFWPVWVGAALGGVTGSTLSWWVGHHFGRAVLARGYFARRTAMLDRATAMLRRWGPWAVLAGHLFAPLTSVVFLMAGIARITFWRFQAFNLPGVAIWAWFLPKAGEYGGYLAAYLWFQLFGA